MVFFARKGETLRVSTLAVDYTPGDLITWDLGGGVPHIGMASPSPGELQRLEVSLVAAAN